MTTIIAFEIADANLDEDGSSSNAHSAERWRRSQRFQRACGARFLTLALFAAGTLAVALAREMGMLLVLTGAGALLADGSDCCIAGAAAWVASSAQRPERHACDTLAHPPLM